MMPFGFHFNESFKRFNVLTYFDLLEHRYKNN